MKKAGGIVAIIAGVLSIFAAILTLFIGGVSDAFGVEHAGTVVGLGWGGIGFSFLVVVLGAIAIGAKGPIPGILIIFSSIAGAILGGIFVAVLMILSLVGGILALFGNKNGAKGDAQPTSIV